MSHTPGKWEAVQIGDTGGENPVDVYEVIADGRKRVAEYVGDADARLIAAAPDLLEALESMVLTFRLRREEWPEIQRAQAAIKKARGE